MCLKHISAYWNILIKSSFSKRKNLPLCHQDITSTMSGPWITSQSTANSCYVTVLEFQHSRGDLTFYPRLSCVRTCQESRSPSTTPSYAVLPLPRLRASLSSVESSPEVRILFYVSADTSTAPSPAVQYYLLKAMQIIVTLLEANTSETQQHNNYSLLFPYMSSSSHKPCVCRGD